MLHFHFSLTLQPGTATVADYTNLPTTVTFGPLDSSTKNIPISITDDDIIEETEMFTASLIGGSGTVVPENGDTATITIIDDDGECLSCETFLKTYLKSD